MDYNFKVREFGEEPEYSSLSERIFTKIGSSWRLFKWAIIVIAALVVLGILMFIMGRASFQEKNLTFTVSAKENIVSGDEVEYQLTINNNNKKPLTNVKLIVFYPNSSLIFDDEGNQLTLVEETPLDTIGAHRSRTFTKKALLIGAPGNVRVARFKLTYQPEGTGFVS